MNRMLLRHIVGATLRRIRLTHGLTLRDLSALSRVSVPYLSEIERGRKEPSSEILATICRVFGMDVVDLVDAVADELRTPDRAVLVMGSTDDHARVSAPDIDHGALLLAA